MPRLQGVGVLVTRPVQQAERLCALLEAEGAVAVRLPAIGIEPVPGAHEFAAGPMASQPFDLVIFTSANAVRFGAALLERLPGAALAAIGPATARALEAAGRPAAVTPAGRFDSESLLAHPRLANLAGRRVLIVTGLHGRELLREELTRRGAHVDIAPVYRREAAAHGAAELGSIAARLRAGEIQIITATSAETAAGLLQIPDADLRRELERAHWLVPGARVAGALRASGLEAPILQAESAEDHDLVAAIVRWRSSASGA
jgi:uroporphyrinogen-III synthase